MGETNYSMHDLKEWNDFQQVLQEIEPYQRKMANLNDKFKSSMLKTGPQPNTTPYSKATPLARSKSAPPGFGAMGEGSADEEIVSSFVLKQILEPNIWEKNRKLRENIRDRLIEIAEDFYGALELEVPLVDVIITGSMANYNWSRYSDIDLHLVLDFSDVNKDVELVKAFFTAARVNWNRTHEILIDNYEVEIYMQDINEPHYSSGVYSLYKDEWVLEPEREEFAIEEDQIFKKATGFIEEIDLIENLIEEEKYEEAYGDADRLKEKIMRYRRAGLERGGDYSVENLAFKYLRRSDDMGRLIDLKRQAYDGIMSIEEQQTLR